MTWRVAPALLVRETGTKLSASAGTGFKAPSLAQLYSDFGNPDLEAEKSFSLDAGVEQSWREGRARTGLTFFWNKFDDMISFDPDNYVLENIAEARTQGLELFGDTQLLDQLTLGGSFTYLRTKDETTGERLLRRPVTQMEINLIYRWAERLRTFLEVVFTGRREDNDYSTFPVERVDLASYTLVNLAAAYDLTGDLQLFGRIDNIFDQEYQDVLGYGSLGAAAYGGLKLKLGGAKAAGVPS